MSFNAVHLGGSAAAAAAAAGALRRGAVLLSRPSLGDAEALALLGTCTAARAVGGAVSLRAVRAVAFVNSAAEEAIPMVRA